MPLSSKLHILVIEDNPGDFLLIQEYLGDAFENPSVINATTLAQAKYIITTDRHISVILLDLGLPDARGTSLVKEITSLTESIPVIVLTGYDDKDFGVNSLYLGIADYLLKDELTITHLHKSILYSIERKFIHNKLNQSEENYRKLFDLSPLPQWVYDLETLQFMDVNNAAIVHYGYSREEFLSMTLHDLRTEESYSSLDEIINQLNKGNIPNKSTWTHFKKNGEQIFVNIKSNPIIFNQRQARLTLVEDITNNLNAETALKASEQRFKALVQEGSDLITIMDITGKYLYVSPSTKSIWGIAPEIFIGKNVFDFVHDEDKEQILTRFKSLSEKKRIEIAPFRFKGKDNEYRWIETTLTDLTDDEAVGGIISNSRDITHRVQIEKEIKENIKRYETVSKATSDAVYEWDMKSNTVKWNQGLKGIFGHNLKQSGVDFWRSFVHPDDLDRIRNNVRGKIDKKELRTQGEYRFKCGDGTYKYVLDRGFIIYNEQDEAEKMIGAMQDITDQTNYIKQIEAQNSRLSEISWTQSHLVRAPLCNVMSLSELLNLETGTQQENQQILEKLIFSAKELDNIIKTILKKADIT